MFYDRQWTYLTTEEFSKIQKSFELKNLKKVQDMKMWLRNWQKQPDFIKHYTILKEQWLVKVPVGVRWIWQDRFTDNYWKVEVVNHPKLINPFWDEEDLDLTEKQDIAIESLLCKNVWLLHRSTGTGKAQPLYSKIMWENWWITMWETKIWDKIFWEDWNLYNITWIFPQWKKDIYEIIFSDGTKTRSCWEHLWKIQDCNDRKRENRVIIRDDDRVKKETYQILELNKIKDNLIKYKWLVSERLNYSIDIIKPLLFNKKELSIHPYLLWLYLWDWTSDYTSISISNSESDIIEKIKLLLNDDLVITQCYDKRSNAITNSIRKKINWKSENSFLTNIKELWLCWLKSYDKFIPKDYLHSSVEDRLLLLQWLLDTDWYVMKWRDGHNSQIEYSTTSEKLKDDIIFLANSLWCNTTYIKRKSWYKKDWQYISCKDHYRIYIYSKDYIVSSKKHLDKYSPSTKIFRKYIKEVNYIWEEECKCIMVDNPSHLYITDDFIITHNTSVIAKLIDKLWCKTLIVCCNLELMNQMRDDMEMFFGVKYRTISWTKTKQKNCYEDIIIWNIDSLVKLPEEYFEQFDLVLMDEVDRFMQRDTRREFIFSLPMKYQYWLTGTIKLNHIEDRIFDIYFWKKTELLLKHFQPTIYKVMTDFEYILDDIKDFHELKARLYWDESRNQLIVDTIVKTINGRKGIVFCEYIEHSKLLCDMLEKQGIKTFMLIWDIKKDERARIKQELKDYKWWPCCLVGSVKIVWRGFSVPELSSWYLLTCEKFSSNIFQYIWRILRLFPWKTSCDFYDFVDTGSNILANQAKARNIQYKKEFPWSKIIYYK